MRYVPPAYEFVLLALASFRLTRLIAWDTWPPVSRARIWLLYRPEGGLRSDALDELFACPFCLGFWISLAFYLAWLFFPTATLAVSIVLALSAIVGLVAKTLDP
jgi:hypothetical protein